MLNIGGGEILVIALVALIVVGPEQLPGVLRKAGRYASQVRSMTSSIRDEFMAGIDEVDPSKWSGDVEGRGDGSADKPIVPRGYADRHDEMTDPSRIKPKTAQMASVDDAQPAEAAEQPVEPEEPTQPEQPAESAGPESSDDTSATESDSGSDTA